MYEVMFLRATIASTSARTSGSEVGNGPAPACSASGAQSAGQFRFRSRPFERRSDRDGDAVPVVDRPLGKHAVEVALDVVRASRDEEPRVVWMRLPGSVRVGHAHEEDAPVCRRRRRDGGRPRAPRAGTAGRSSGGSGRPRARPRRRPGSRAGRRRTSVCRGRGRTRVSSEWRRWSRRLSAAVVPVNSIAWICAWTKTAGFSSAGPVSAFVTVQSQMSRPSYDFPMASYENSEGCSDAHASSVSVSSAYV